MRIKIEFEIELPDIESTEYELDAYLRYSYGDNCSVAIANPFNVLGEPVIRYGTFTWNRE